MEYRGRLSFAHGRLFRSMKPNNFEIERILVDFERLQKAQDLINY